MTTISLQDYLQQIENMIGEDRSAEAAMHCRHILQQYPRHIDTYRLFAKALLEQGEFGAAADLFQRVLSAIPNDFISHVGLSEALKEQSIQPQSHWHLERAFEMQPYHGAIRQELSVSYRQNGESVNELLPLTPGALARLHFRSGMYVQSAMELRQALKDDPDRVDLETLLAELLWRDGQRVAAVNLCHRVLDVMPDCIPAKAILADIWLRTGQIQEAQPLLKQLQKLTQIDAAHVDEETAVGQAFMAVGAPEIPDELMAEYLGDADRYSQPGLAETAVEGEGGEEIDASYDWLTAVESESELFQEGELDGEWEKPETDWLVDPDAPADELEVEGDSADWLTDLDAMTDADDFDALFTDDAAGGDTAVAEDPEDTLDWLTETTQDDFDAIQISPEDAAEWMAATDSDLFSESGVEADDGEDSEWLAKPDEADSEFAISEPGAVALPDWLNEAEEPVDVISEADGLPDWLAGEGDESQEQVEELAGVDDDTLPGWLTDELDETVVAEKAPDDMSDEDELPGWLAGAEAETPASAVESKMEEAPDWVTGELDETLIGVGEPEEETETAVSDELPDWITGELDESQAGAEADTAVPLDEPVDSIPGEISSEADLPDWLSDEESDEDVETAVAQLPDWLESDSEEILPVAEEPQTDADLMDALPDWLTESEGEAGGELEEDVIAEQDDMMPGLPDEPEDEPKPERAEEDEDLLSLLAESGAGSGEEDAEDLLADLLAPAAEESEFPIVVEEYLSDSLVGILDELAPDATDDGTSSDAPPTGELSDSLVELLDEMAPMDSGELADLEAQDDQPIVAADLPNWLMDMAPEGATTESETDEPEPEAEGDADDLTILTNLLAEAEDSDTEMEIGDLNDDLAWLTPIDDDGVEAEASKIVTGWLSSDPGFVSETKGWTDELLESAESLNEEEEEELNGTIDWLAGLAAASMAEISPDEELAGETPVGETPEAELTHTEPELAVDDDLDFFDTLVDEAEMLDSESEDAALGDAEEADELDWLSGLAVDAELPETDDLADAVVALGDDDLEMAGDAVEDVPVLADEGDSDLSWLSDLAVGADDELAASPTLEEADAEPTPAETAVDDVEDAMTWLEGLAAEQGAPVEELPSIAQKIEADTEAELSETPPSPVDDLIGDEVDDAMTWLEGLEAEKVEMAAESPETAVDEDEAEPEMYQPPEWVSVSQSVLPGNVEDVPEEVDDAMSWLTELAAEQGAELTEDADTAVTEDALLPTEPELEIEPEPELTAEPLVDDSLLAALDWLGANVGDSESESLPEQVAVSDDELANALDFLEQLDVSSPAETAETAVGPSHEVVTEFDSDILGTMPDDPDEAMDWLANFAGPDTGVDMPVAEPEVMEPESEQLETSEPEPAAPPDVEATMLAEMPDDPDEAMTWLAQLADEEPEAAPAGDAEPDVETAVPDLEDVLGDVEPEPAADVEADGEYLDAMPEDPDEAMAWLEKLAARQGAPAEELPSVSVAEAADLQEFELPDIDSLTAESEQRGEPEMAPTEPMDSAPPVPTTDDLLTPDDELVDALPDWLTQGPGLSDETGHTGWLRSLDEPDVAGWLAGEEDVAATGIYKKQDWTDFSSETKIETGPLPSLDAGTGDLAAETDELTLFDDDIVLPDTGPLTSSVDEDALLSARRALNLGDFEGGVDDYRVLVEAGDGLGSLITDLETAVTTYNQQPMLRHVLGDAYMRNGQLQKALETYRHALDLL